MKTITTAALAVLLALCPFSGNNITAQETGRRDATNPTAAYSMDQIKALIHRVDVALADVDELLALLPKDDKVLGSLAKIDRDQITQARGDIAHCRRSYSALGLSLIWAAATNAESDVMATGMLDHEDASVTDTLERLSPRHTQLANALAEFRRAVFWVIDETEHYARSGTLQTAYKSLDAYLQSQSDAANRTVGKTP
jgi:hypothetical protein